MKFSTEFFSNARLFARWALRISLGGLAVIYFFGVFVNRELGLATRLEKPLQMTALLFIVAILEEIRDELSKKDAAEVTVYRSYDDFYNATRQAVRGCTERIYVTALHSTSPTERNAAYMQHLEACRQWARSSPKHSFRRVVGSASNQRMQDFLRQELAEVTGAKAADLQYSIKMLNVEQTVGAIAIGIYDYEQVFISYVSARDRIVGIGIRSRDVVQAFEHYYEHLWHSPAVSDIEEALGARD